MLILVLNQRKVRVLSSDFRSENPLTQTRTFHTRNRYHTFEQTLRLKITL